MFSHILKNNFKDFTKTHPEIHFLEIQAALNIHGLNGQEVCER